MKAANSMGNTRIDKIKKDKDRKKLTDSYSKKDGKRENSFKEGEEKKSDKEDSISKEAAKSAKKEEKKSSSARLKKPKKSVKKIKSDAVTSARKRRVTAVQREQTRAFRSTVKTARPIPRWTV